MRVLVCGGRNFADHRKFSIRMDAVNEQYGPLQCVIEGGASGADRMAWRWATKHFLPIETYSADWKNHGRAAGPIRNERMLREGRPDLVIAFPGGRGTANMVSLARAAGVRVIEVQ